MVEQVWTSHFFEAMSHAQSHHPRKGCQLGSGLCRSHSSHANGPTPAPRCGECSTWSIPVICLVISVWSGYVWWVIVEWKKHMDVNGITGGSRTGDWSGSVTLPVAIRRMILQLLIPVTSFSLVSAWECNKCNDSKQRVLKKSQTLSTFFPEYGLKIDTTACLGWLYPNDSPLMLFCSYLHSVTMRIIRIKYIHYPVYICNVTIREDHVFIKSIHSITLSLSFQRPGIVFLRIWRQLDDKALLQMQTLIAQYQP